MTRAQFDWEAIRAAYAAGGPTATFGALSKRFGPSKAVIHRRATSEQWTQNLEPAVQAKVAEKLAAGIPEGDGDAKGDGVTPQKRAEAVNAEAERRVAVIARHRNEVNNARERIYTGLANHKAAKDAAQRAEAFDQLKAGKIASEALQILQNAERRAWNITPQAGDDDGSGIRKVIVELQGDPYAEPAPSGDA